MLRVGWGKKLTEKYFQNPAKNGPDKEQIGKCQKYIHDKIKAKTLFSTHYHELTFLEKDLKQLKNVHVSAIEENGRVTFLHKVKPGAIDKSYGIHVASLANLPKSLIERAEDVLNVYEKKSIKKEVFTQTSLFELNEEEIVEKENPIEEKIKEINPLEMTPMEAINFLYNLKKEIKERKWFYEK